MALRRFALTVVAAADGTATAYFPYASGYIHQIEYVKAGSNNYTDGVDFTITLDVTGQGVWTESNVNASAVRAPRQPTHTQAGVGLLYASGAPAVSDRIALSADRVEVVLASAGNATTGLFYLTIDDGR